MIYPIKHLPHVIPIGTQTESGVEAIGFDVKPWLDEYGDLNLSIWPTRPGEATAYPAAHTEMVGTVLYWFPNEADTAISGTGKVELLGLTADKRKLSGWCETNVRSTSLATTKEPPDANRPWIDAVMLAAQEIKDLIAFGVENGGSMVYIGVDGKLVPLALGAGLEIVDGVLRVTGTVTPPDGPDGPITPPEAIAFVEQTDGSILVKGVTFVEQADGSILWDGATFAEQTDGSYLVS